MRHIRFDQIQLAAGALTASRLRSGFGTAYIGLGFLLFWIPGDTRWLELLSILAVPVLLRTVRHFRPSCRETLPATTALELAAIASIWLWVTRATVEAGWGNQLTVAWALLGLVLLAAGLLSRIRLDRFSGLAIVALAVGRLFVFDVWRFDTLYRILSFLALGTVLLVMSFLYHTLAEKLRSWT